MSKKSNALPAFHVMAKPTGSQCNLHCDYCFYLKKKYLYPKSTFHMPNRIMERYIRQTIQGHKVPYITIAWQGGEPTLMGLEFYRHASEIIRKAARPGMQVEQTFQTNGVLIDEEWCRFFHDNNVLVGLSIDGPRQMHDTYRKDKAGHSVFNKVIHAAHLMQSYDVQFNILCTVNDVNSQHPMEVYRFFRDELKAPYLQFIPIVERDNATGNQQGNKVTSRSVGAKQFGRFLIEIFDEWVKKDVGDMFVQFFDGVLASYVRGYSSLCVLSPRCGEGVALEHNGDLYSCDHYVEPDYLLGNITRRSISELVSSSKQSAFGIVKQQKLPRYCRLCEFLFTCYGECPKNRICKTPDGENDLNYLCEGLKAFFTHTKPEMEKMAKLLLSGRPASDIMRL
jgi:uncharacterized protein